MKTLSLDGRWSFSQLPEEISESELKHWQFTEADAAEVPGCVHLDLMRAGKISDPFRNRADEAVRWVEEVDWVYVKEFELSPDDAQARAAELVFDGLDTFATIYLNGHRVGQCSNMFVPRCFDVGGRLVAGVNRLMVKFDSATRQISQLEARYGPLEGAFESRAQYARKAKYSFGWDWGPRLATCGIWRGVRLHLYEEARLHAAYLNFISVTRKNAIGYVQVEVSAAGRFSGEVEVRLANAGHEHSYVFPVRSRGGTEVVRRKIEVKRPALWWPAGMGAQPLYELKVQLKSGAVVLDTLVKRTGIRSLKLRQPSDRLGRRFYFSVNGKRVFCRGANWVPADSFLPRVSEATYRKLLAMVPEANMNMLRVWGGGVYEDDAFYDLCDELGIMVWQDFMYSCGQYPDQKWFERAVSEETTSIVQRLKHHPSIALWCGNNEINWMYGGEEGRPRGFSGSKYFERVIPEICEHLDPRRPYVPSSPWGGTDPNSQQQGDRHNWDVWHEFKDVKEYTKDKGKFISEFGLLSMPSSETLGKYTQMGSADKLARALEHRTRSTGGIERFYRYVAALFPVPADARRLALYSQLMQGEGLKVAAEHWRRLKFSTSGALIWQFNDCWPGLSWSLVDWEGRPKASYYYAKRFFNPVCVTVHRHGDYFYVCLINDKDEDIDVRVDFYLLNVSGQALVEKTTTRDAKRNSLKILMKIPAWSVPIERPDSEFLYVRAMGPGGIECDNSCFLRPFKLLRLERPTIRYEVSEDADNRPCVTLSTDTLARGVKLTVPRVDCTFSDNFFDLVPGFGEIVTVELPAGVSTSDLDKRLEVSAYPY